MLDEEEINIFVDDITCDIKVIHEFLGTGFILPLGYPWVSRRTPWNGCLGREA